MGPAPSNLANTPMSVGSIFVNLVRGEMVFPERAATIARVFTSHSRRRAPSPIIRGVVGESSTPSCMRDSITSRREPSNPGRFVGTPGSALTSTITNSIEGAAFAITREQARPDIPAPATSRRVMLTAPWFGSQMREHELGRRGCITHNGCKLVRRPKPIDLPS